MAEETVRNEKLLGALAYLLGPVTGIVFLLSEKKNQFIRFHAMQSTITFGGLFLLQIVLGIIPVIGWIVSLVILPILGLAAFILWLLLMWKAYNGEKYMLPFIGEVSLKQLEKIK
jgi:uncharacterized membrane protein